MEMKRLRIKREAEQRDVKEIFIESLVKRIKGDIVCDGHLLLEPRTGGEFSGKAIYLSEYDTNWEIGRDDEGALILVPIKIERR